MPTIDSSQQQFADWIRDLPPRLNALGASTCPREDKVALVLELDKFIPYKSLPQWKDAFTAIRDRIGIPRERFAIIMQLPRKEDIRRALICVEPTPLARFPDERVYPTNGWLGEYLTCVEGMEVPLGWHFWSGVAAIAIAARRNFGVDRNSYYLWPNHYIMIVGPTGEHKSSAIDQVRTVLEMANTQLERYNVEEPFVDDRQICIHDGAGSPEGFMDMLQVQEEFVLNDNQKVQPRGRSDSSILLVNDECVNLLGKAQIGGDRWVDRLTTLYGCRSEWSERLRTGQRVRNYRNIAVSTLLGSTAEWLGKSCTPEMFAGGAMGRYVYVERDNSGRSFPTPMPVDPVTQWRLAAHLAKITTAPFGTPTRFESAALTWFEEWYEHYNSVKAETEIMRGYRNRRPDHMLKLSIILALSIDPRAPVINRAIIELANEILIIEEKTLASTFLKLVHLSDPKVTIEKKAETVAYQILYAHGGGMERGEWARASDLSGRGFTDAVKGLAEKGLILAYLEKDTKRPLFRVKDPTHLP